MDKVSKEVKIGIAFVIAIFLLYYGISFLKGINIFKSSNSYIVVFDDVTGLTQATPVTLNGFKVGLVSSMKLDPNDPKPKQFAFGFGRRICPGRCLSMTSIWLSIAPILATFEIRKPKDQFGNVIEPTGEYTTGLIRSVSPTLPRR